MFTHEFPQSFCQPPHIGRLDQSPKQNRLKIRFKKTCESRDRHPRKKSFEPGNLYPAH